MKKLMQSTSLFLAAAICALAGAGGQADAQETKVMKVTHVYNANVYLWEYGGQVFVDEVTKALGDKIKFEIYPSAQLGKDVLTTIKSGLADIAIIIPSIATDKLPLSSVSELPGAYTKACEGTSKLWNIAKAGGPLDTAEYSPQGVHVLFVTTLPPYHITTAKEVPANIAGLSGLKLRASGAAMDKTVRALGAVPVKLAASELYDSISRGTIDGGLYNYLGVPEYKLEGVLKYAIQGPSLGAATVVFGMSKKSWDALSDDMKTIFTEASLKAQTALCEWEDENDLKLRDRMVSQNGLKIVDLTPDERAVWEAKTAEVTAGWMKEMDAAGKNGTAIFNAFKEGGK